MKDVLHVLTRDLRQLRSGWFNPGVVRGDDHCLILVVCVDDMVTVAVTADVK